MYFPRQDRPQVHDTHRKHITPLTDENLFLPATQRPARHNGHAHRADRSRRPDNLHRRRRPNGINHTGRQHSHGPEPQPRQRRRATSRGILRHGRTAGGTVSRNIYKYRAAGGIYRQPRDFARLYGLTAGQYRRLEPYIRISDDYRPAAEAYPAEPRPAYVRDTTRYPLKLKPGQHVALNTADTTLLKRVPGIGSGFARAIVRYRERLGGFYSTAQLMEIGNFPQSALPYFTADPSLCRKLNVNRLTLSQLRRHPYIGFYQAKTIIDHRRLHGPLRSLDDLRLYKDFPPETIERLRHYIEF